MAEQLDGFDVYTREKLDGIVIVSTGWSFLNPDVNFRFDNNILIKKARKGIFKGMDGFNHKTQEMYTIFLGTSMARELYQVIIVPKSFEVDFVQVLHAFKVAVNNSVKKMPESDTYKHWSVQTPREFVITFHGVGGARTIFCDDYSLFGETLYSQLCSEFNTIFRGFYKTMTVMKNYGQNRGWDLGVENLSYTFRRNFSEMNQLILHYAIDFERPNYALFWDRKELINHGFPGTTTHEYYPGLLHKNGNYYFNIDPVHSRDNIRIVEIKTYGHLFRECHRVRTTPPFIVNEISRDLLYHRTDVNSLGGKTGDPWNNHEDSLLWAERQITEINSPIKARMEAIVSFKRLHNRSTFLAAIAILKQRPLLDKLSLYMCINDVKIPELKRFLIKSVFPFTNTLKYFLQNRLQLLDSFDLEHYYNAQACEAVLCCTLYGTANHSRHLLKYPFQWLKKLGITKTQFRKGRMFDFSPSFGCYFDQARQLVLFTQPMFPDFPIPVMRLSPIATESLEAVHHCLTKGTINDTDIDTIINHVLMFLHLEIMDIAKPPKQGKYNSIGDYRHEFVALKAKYFPVKTILSSREIATALTTFPIPENTEYPLDYNSLVKVFCYMIVYGLHLLDKSESRSSRTSHVKKFRDIFGRKIEKLMVDAGREFFVLKRNGRNGVGGVAFVGLPWCGINWNLMSEDRQNRVVEAFEYWTQKPITNIQGLSKATIKFCFSLAVPHHKKYDMSHIADQLIDWENLGIFPEIFNDYSI